MGGGVVGSYLSYLSYLRYLRLLLPGGGGAGRELLDLHGAI